MEKQKILILSCGTGGGHNTAARAIQEDLIEKGIEADFIEYLDIINPKIRKRVNKLYISTTKRQGKIFKRIYKLGELYSKTKLKSPIYVLNKLNKDKLYKYIEENEYTYVVTTHLFAAQALTEVKKEYNIHFLAVATDYVSIPFWEETNPDYFVIPSEDLKENFISKGIPEKKLLPYGIPVFKAYRKQETKEDAKKSLKLKIDKDYILMVTGSMGFGNINKMIEGLLENIKDVIFIVCCGNNKKMLDNINKEFESEERIIALSYTNNLAEYMSASEIVLTKPGGLTTTEVRSKKKTTYPYNAYTRLRKL